MKRDLSFREETVERSLGVTAAVESCSSRIGDFNGLAKELEIDRWKLTGFICFDY
jgi:hypothetical protein